MKKQFISLFLSLNVFSLNLNIYAEKKPIQNNFFLINEQIKSPIKQLGGLALLLGSSIGVKQFYKDVPEINNVIQLEIANLISELLKGSLQKECMTALACVGLSVGFGYLDSLVLSFDTGFGTLGALTMVTTIAHIVKDRLIMKKTPLFLSIQEKLIAIKNSLEYPNPNNEENNNIIFQKIDQEAQNSTLPQPSSSTNNPLIDLEQTFGTNTIATPLADPFTSDRTSSSLDDPRDSENIKMTPNLDVVTSPRETSPINDLIVTGMPSENNSQSTSPLFQKS